MPQYEIKTNNGKESIFCDACEAEISVGTKYTADWEQYEMYCIECSPPLFEDEYKMYLEIQKLLKGKK